jgi:hypothetical protein
MIAIAEQLEAFSDTGFGIAGGVWVGAKGFSVGDFNNQRVVTQRQR